MSEPFTERMVRPKRVAALLAGLYVALSVIYIVTSSRVAAVAAAGSVESLERLERLKGTLFVLGTGVLFYFVAWYLLSRMARQREQIARQQEALIASEHRALSGLFAASVAHDFNNLATVARGSAELLAQPALSAELRDRAAASLQDAFNKLSALSQRLMTLGRAAPAAARVERDLAAAVERAVALARRHERVRGCRIHAATGGVFLVPFDETMVDRMLLNLILNAAEATKGLGRIDVRLVRRPGAVAIEVHDDGPGVPEEKRQSIFDAFYTSKSGGLGLGLLSVKACAEAHGGQVEVERSELGGAVIRVSIPAV